VRIIYAQIQGNCVFTSACGPVTITVEAADPKKETLTYTWTVVSKPDSAADQVVTLVPNGASASFFSDLAGNYTLRVDVTNTDGRTASLSFPIHVVGETSASCNSLFDRFNPYAPSGVAVDHLTYGNRTHFFPMPGTPPPDPRCTLTNHGGSLLPNPGVVPVLWGAGANAGEASSVSSLFGSLFTDRRYQGYLQTLTQYTGAAPAGASVAPTVTITPIDASTTLSESAIQAELANQITRGTLPLPNGSTMYAVFLPSSFTETLTGQGSSCASGGFCAYHGSFKYDGVPATYAVMPDCGGGCSATVAGSHELIEAMTDPMIGFVGPGSGGNLGWYDDENPPCNGEIADLCLGQDYTLGSYTVASAWSNDAAQCVVSTLAQTTIEFYVQTGHDDLRQDSELDAILTGTDGAKQTITLRSVGGPTWDNGNEITQDFTLNLPSSIASIQFELLESDPSCNISCDNWDLANLDIRLLNQDGTTTCVTHLRGNNGGTDNDGDAVARLTRDNNTVTFSDGQGCP